MADETTKQTAHCTSCGCKMDITGLAPYTNVVCPHCEHHTRVKCELGPYLLTNRHAAGGMSMVFAARDTTLDREVALKILNSTYSQDDVRMQQFEQEAKITAAISHPHVVKVFTVGQEHGQFYIAMEMVPGENLEQRMTREGALPEDVVLPIVAEVISGLSAANEAGLIHRDIKPGNILFDSNDHAKIVDFGLSLVTQGGKAKADEVWATPYYVPPEALDGLEEDFRSDIYALGATLYHTLSGKPPISEDSKSTKAVRQAKNTIPPIADVAPWLRPETCYLVDKAMALNPKDRFSSYAEMETAWQAASIALAGGEVAKPIRSEQRAQRRAGSKKGIGSLIACSVIALALVGGAVMMFLDKQKPDDGETDQPNSPTPPIADTQDDSNYSPEILANIARMQRRAHAQIRNKQYPEARASFQALMRDKSVQEPTASWAAVEAYIADLLCDHGDGSRPLLQLHQHIRSKPDLREDRIHNLANQLSSPGTVHKPNTGNDPLGIIPLTAVALKNWELGAWDAAVPQFKRITEYPLPNGSPLLVYRDIAALHIEDFNTLAPYRDIALPYNLTETKKLSDNLRELLGKLKTTRQGGRTKFNLRIWQFRVVRHAKRLKNIAAKAEAERNKPPLYQDVLPDFHKLLAKSQFAEAAALLNKADTSLEQAAQREAWVYLCDSADAFLGDLAKAIPEKGAKASITGTDGQKFTAVLSASEEGLTVKGAAEAELTWSEIQPASLIDLHTTIFKHKLNTLDGQIGTEQAVCFAWITDQKTKAKTAAGKLGALSKNFHKRWENTMDALK